MTPQSRLSLWYVLVITVVLTQHLWLESNHTFQVIGLSVVIILLLLIALLLLTTPSNAIRLKPIRSVVILSLLSTLLYVHATIRFAFDWQTILVVGFALLTAILFTVIAVHKRRSPWWVVPLWWNPLMVGPYALPDTAVMVLSVVMLGGMIALPRKPELTA